MRIKAHLPLVDVLLETAEEQSLAGVVLERAINTLLLAEQVDPSRVVDWFFNVLTETGEWQPVGRNDEGQWVVLNLNPLPNHESRKPRWPK